MLTQRIAFLFFFLSVSCRLSAAGIAVADTLTFYDGRQFSIIGKYHDEKNYVRFPQQYKNTLRKEVWDLGQHSAGISIRFRSNASTIAVRWTVMNDSNLPHMPATGVKGVDLYAYVNNQWQYIRTGFPKGKTNEAVLLPDGDATFREYLLNLPLYDGVDSLQIGVNRDAKITNPADNHLMDKNPVVYYGSSIAQGGCASRPGLVFTNVLSRKLDRSFINFGFSGNGRFETSVGEAMSEIDAALYVIDCNPNTDVELIYDRTIALVQLLKKHRPNVPVLLVEGFENESSYFNKSTSKKNVLEKQKELKRGFDFLRNSNVTKLHYQEGKGLIGYDHEGTVDGIHPTDVGMMRIADKLLPVIKGIL